VLSACIRTSAKSAGLPAKEPTNPATIEHQDFAKNEGSFPLFAAFDL
jgi:hypothetical protein